jgi:hypothetical protein
MTRHVHADHMIAAANDTTIEWQVVSTLSREWIYTGKSGEFMFYPDEQYRQKPAPHPHLVMMGIAKDDPSIEWQFQNSIGLGLWLDCKPEQLWFSNCQYRQKPHPHQTLIDQAKADRSIEWQLKRRGSDWQECDPWRLGDSWDKYTEYRQKPAEPKMVDLWQWAVKWPDNPVIFAMDEFFADAVCALKSRPGFIIVSRIEGSKISVEVSQ